MPDLSYSDDYTRQEIILALRNHGLHLEGLRYLITPVGMHYLLIHFDIPHLSDRGYEIDTGGAVRHPRKISLEEIKSRPRMTVPVTMECGGTGRAKLEPRPIVWPWKDESIGCSIWTGTPLRPLLEQAGLLEDAVEIVFTGHDRGFDQGYEHNYERSIPLSVAMSNEVFLAYEINGMPLPPQHGFPLRLIVPGWYGMTSVKWIKSITVVTERFKGVQQSIQYRYKRSEDDPGVPITRKNPHAVMIPPGMPDLVQRNRYVRVGKVAIEGRAWSGWGTIIRVEFSADGGRTWEDCTLGQDLGRYAWTHWTHELNASQPGDYEICVRATDSAGNTQPVDSDEAWNYGGYGMNSVQRTSVFVR